MPFLEFLQFVGVLALVFLVSWIVLHVFLIFAEQPNQPGKLKEFKEVLSMFQAHLLKEFLSMLFYPPLILVPLTIALAGGFIASFIVRSPGTWQLGFEGGLVGWLIVGLPFVLTLYVIHWRRILLYLPESGEDALARGVTTMFFFLSWSIAALSGAIGWLLYRAFL